MATIAEIKVWWNNADKLVRDEADLRWLVAQGLWERNQAGDTQDALADELERHQGTICRYIKVWCRYGLDDEGLTWNQCFQRVKVPKPKPDPEPDDEHEDALGHNGDPAGENALPPTFLDLLSAIGDGIEPDVYADKATQDDWLARREAAEELYDWVCRFDLALETRFDPTIEE